MAEGYDPKLDKSNSEYDPKLDPNAPEFDQKARDDYDAEHANAEPKPAEAAAPVDQASGESAKPSGEFENEPKPKPEDSAASGTKSVLTPAKDPIPAPMVAQPQPMTPADPKAPATGPDAQQQIYSSAIAPERDPDKAWQEYAVTAINGLYPRLRNGIDFAVGRRSIDGDIELFEGQDAGVDWGKVEEHARKLAGGDPYQDYKPKPSLAGGRDPGTASGEVPIKRGSGLMQDESERNYELPSNVAQSEVNPTLEGAAKSPTQGYKQQSPPGAPPKTPEDPYFNADGTRKQP